ncbi:MAG: FHA domain-containing protein [Coriobacteriia bacterium]|nr:FHA domain-containing protein [Coriobacteriia bacterium]
MADCPACGANIGKDEDRCPSCGSPAETTTEAFSVLGEPPRPGPAEDVGGPVLVVRKGPEVGERFFIEAESMTLGRDPDCDVFLNDVTVSRRHARVFLKGADYVIEDVGSLNGTYVNGVRVDAAPLHAGDIVQVGTFQMVFYPGGGG